MDKKIIIFILITLILALIVISSIINLGGGKNKPEPSNPVRMIEDNSQSAPAFPAKTLREGAGLESEEFLKREREFLRKTPILQKLPFGNPNFEVEYISEQHLIVYAKTQNKEQDYQIAKQWFSDNGIDTSKINIEYK